MRLKFGALFFSASLAMAALSFALAACNTVDDEMGENPPPADAFEVLPIIQNPQVEIWRPGYWSRGSDEDFVWVPGELIARPTPTAVWAAARWVHHTYGWTFEQGHWE